MIIFVPSHRENPEAVADAVRDLDEEEIVTLRKSSEAFYTVFANITSIFPLLGILGTVISLMPMVADMADMSRNFFAALTSTFWGLVFAIIFKLLDGFLVSRIEDNDKNVTLLLDRSVLTQKASLR
jgi:chemotaxis protein MotA